MKSPRITLSIALLLSLPAKVYAADVSTITFYQEQLGALDDAIVTHKTKVLAELPKLPNYQSVPYDANTDYAWQRLVDDRGKVTYTAIALDHGTLTTAYHADAICDLDQNFLDKKDRVHASLPKAPTPSCVWQRIEIDGKVVYIPTEMSDGALEMRMREDSAQYFEDIAHTERKGQSVFAQLKKEDESQTGAASSSSTGFISLVTSYFSSAPKAKIVQQDNWTGTTYFKDGVEHAPVAWQSNVQQEAYAAELQERLEQTPALIEQKETIFGRKTHTSYSRIGLRLKNNAFVASYSTLVRIYKDSGLNQSMRCKPGLPQAELNLFNQETICRDAARKGKTADAAKQLVESLNQRNDRILGTFDGQSMDPGLNLLTALSAKTLEQRTKVHTQLLATLTVLSKELAEARTQVTYALKEHADNELIFRLGALTQAAKVEGTTEDASDALWTLGVLEQFISSNQETSLKHLPLAGFAHGANALYKSWHGANALYKSWYTYSGEPADAAALRLTSEAIATTEEHLAQAKAQNKGRFIDCYTQELLRLREQQEAQFIEVNKHIAEPVRALLLTHAPLLDACTRIDNLTPAIAHLKTTLTADAAGHTENLATLAARLALLTADDREQGMYTRDALIKLFSTSRERNNLKRSKMREHGRDSKEERTPFTVKSQDPDYYFVRDVITPAVDAAIAAAKNAADSSSSSAASSSSSSSSSSSC